MERIAREEGKYQVHGIIQLLMLPLQIQLQLRSNANDNQSQFCAVQADSQLSTPKHSNAPNANLNQNAVWVLSLAHFRQICFILFYFSLFSIAINASTKSSSCVALLLRFVSPRDSRDEKYGGTEESFSSEKCLRGANVFSVSVRHISLPGPELASVLIFH